MRSGNAGGLGYSDLGLGNVLEGFAEKFGEVVGMDFSTAKLRPGAGLDFQPEGERAVALKAPPEDAFLVGVLRAAFFLAVFFFAVIGLCIWSFSDSR